MSGLITDIAVLRELLKERAPDIVDHLDRCGLPFAVITTKWLVCMFAEVLPIETVLRVWDCLFFEGSKVSARFVLEAAPKLPLTEFSIGRYCSGWD